MEMYTSSFQVTPHSGGSNTEEEAEYIVFFGFEDGAFSVCFWV
jgi:hypothetical protein